MAVYTTEPMTMTFFLDLNTLSDSIPAKGNPKISPMLMKVREVA
jgi:hypothetical protein